MAYSQYGGGYEESQMGYDDQQRAPPAGYNTRPMVDPEAEGEVDPNQWVILFPSSAGSGRSLSSFPHF